MAATVYADWYSLYQKAALYDRYEERYQSFVNLATARVESGASSPLELLTAKNKLENLRLGNRQTQEGINWLQQQLQLLIDSREDLIPGTGATERFPLSSTDSLVNHPLLDYSKQLQAVTDQQLAVERSELLPEFTVGFAYQQFGGVAGLYGLRLGVNIPIFQGAQRKRIAATKAQQQLVRSQQASNYAGLQRRWLELQQSLQQRVQALDFYTENGEQYAAELLRTAQLRYRAGEIDYVEFVQALEQAFALEAQYLEDLRLYNRAVVLINYLNL